MIGQQLAYQPTSGLRRRLLPRPRGRDRARDEAGRRHLGRHHRGSATQPSPQVESRSSPTGPGDGMSLSTPHLRLSEGRLHAFDAPRRPRLCGGRRGEAAGSQPSPPAGNPAAHSQHTNGTSSCHTKGTGDVMSFLITLLIIFLVFLVAGWGWRAAARSAVEDWISRSVVSVIDGIATRRGTELSKTCLVAG